MDITLSLRLEFLALALSLSCFLFSFAYYMGFFRIPEGYFLAPPSVHFSDVLGVFVVFLAIELLFVPLLLLLFFSLRAGHLLEPPEIQLELVNQGWLNLIAIVSSCLGIFFYLFLKPEFLQRLIFFGGPTKGWQLLKAIKDFMLGSLTWVMSYPCVIAASQLIGIFLYLFHAPIPVDQVAVKQLKMTLGDPVLFITTALVISIVVPISEEIVFRGFVQRWLVKVFGTLSGIFLGALIFALFHFSPSQGWQNIELLLSLVILGLFLGFLYERQGSLLAPIGLHITFNAISVFMISKEGIA